MKVLFVGGDFDDNGGRASGYFKKFYEEFKTHMNEDDTVVGNINGGTFKKLQDVFNVVVPQADVVIWFANVPNDKPKLVREIKTLNQKCMLITSKSNYNGDYGVQDLISRALENKANLLVEFRKGDVIKGNVIDPLGNIYTSNVDGDINELTECIINRINVLRTFTRAGSMKVGDTIPLTHDTGRFISIINECADKFHTLIHGVNTSRMLGNASFRCENGFPSVRTQDKIFVSRRNIDKRDIGTAGFVACDPVLVDNKVQYYGDNKPSVDTPIQLLLYRHYEKINYMIHSHVYVQDAPFTSSKVSCGALEEFDEIIDVVSKDSSDFAVNLFGHGSLICVSSPDNFDLYTDKYISRPSPEA